MSDPRKRYVVATLRDAQIQDHVDHTWPDRGLPPYVAKLGQEDGSLIIFELQDSHKQFSNHGWN
jgi:hypothetical protein